MAVYLPQMMQNLFNTPLALHPRKAAVICAALTNRLNLASIEDASLSNGRLERGDMLALAERARRNEMAGIPNAPAPMKTEDGWYGDRPYEISPSGIAMLQIWGTLTRTWGVGPFSGMTGYDGIMTQVDFAQQDPMCRGIFSHINSGGGAVDGLFECSDFIAACSARNGGKPHYAYAGDYAYSAAYALGSACDKLFVGECGGVGSIGAIMLHADITGALTDAGIDVMVFRSAARKAIGIGGVESLDQREKDHIQEQIDRLGAIFCKRVSTYMPALTQSAVVQTEGLDYMGDSAKAIGLVNDVVSMPEAWAKLERRIAR